jgi:phosphate:Na+ symporter
MSKVALGMWKSTFRAFMDHDLYQLSLVLDQENKLNDLEKELTNNLVIFSKVISEQEENVQIAIYADIITDLELIGDYCKDILERVEVKINEKLLFSDEAVKEYAELYRKTEEVFEEVVYTMETGNFDGVKEILRKELHIDYLVDQYRQHHNQRLLAGLCNPLSGNMYMNMLDFTAAVYYHTKKIARSLLKLKQLKKK